MSKLSTGAIVGIVIGAVCAVLLLMIAAYLISKRMPASSADGAVVGGLVGAGVIGGR